MRFILFLVVFLFSFYATSASFDCTKSTTLNEKRICSNPTLSKLDEDMAILYKKLVSKMGNALESQQVQWIKTQRACKDEACLIAVYENRIKELAEELEIPTHCSNGEVTLLTARMGKTEKEKFKPNNKVISICVDKNKEPFTKLSYRYGKLGAIEMEHIATPQSKVFLHFEQTTPRTNLTAIWFRKGKFTYVVIQCGGHCSSVSLQVFQDEKRITNLESPYGKFDGFFDMDFMKAQSPIFKIQSLGLNLN